MSKAYSIVGQQHQANADAILAELEPGETVTLVREPTNRYDPNAVAVWVGGSKVGYIPSKQNKVLAAFIDQTGRDHSRSAPAMAEDAKPSDLIVPVVHKAIDARFIRSPNSKFPMVEV